MAEQRIAKIVSSQQLNSETKLLQLMLADGEFLNFIGGQYLIVNTNIQLPGGKTAKRAYSILSSDSHQSQFQIAVKKVGSGPGSNYMHQTEIGAELPFSGPWGQFLPDASTSLKRTLVLATDTGITAALGLVQGKKFKSQVKKARLIWCKEDSNYFLPEEFVEGLVVSEGLRFQLLGIPPVNHPDRPSTALNHFKNILDDEPPESVFLSGDGNLLYLFKEELLSRGISENQIKIECFFNNPFKKVVTQK